MYFGPYSYTMTKSSAILFILLFSLLFKLEEVVRVPRNALGRETGSTPTRNVYVEEESNYMDESERDKASVSAQLQESSEFVFDLIQRVTLLLVVLLIAGGLFMFTYKSTQFNAQGFVLVLCASFLGGIRWTLTQILMQKAELGMWGVRKWVVVLVMGRGIRRW